MEEGRLFDKGRELEVVHCTSKLGRKAAAVVIRIDVGEDRNPARTLLE